MNQLSTYKAVPVSISAWIKELRTEAKEILDWWMKNMIDEQYGGFFGSVDYNNSHLPGAEKSVVMYSRICRTFSVAYTYFNQIEYQQIASRAYKGLLENFSDKENGGVFWSINQDGTVCDSRKQIYGQAFSLYALAAYSMAFQDEEALNESKKIFREIHKYGCDTLHKGYWETLDQQWKPLSEMRLSEKDLPAEKTFNTHLHLAEAFASLYKVWPVDEVKNALSELLGLIADKFFDQKSNHYLLYFNSEWKSADEIISFGHDIEAGWLLLQCAEIIQDESLSTRYQQWLLPVCNEVQKYIDQDGGLWYEIDNRTKKINKEKHWWPQAEAMIGYVKAYELSGSINYLETASALFEFIKMHLKDKKHGEWYWGLDVYGAIMQKEKAGFWKCPYHNVRACLESADILEKLQLTL